MAATDPPAKTVEIKAVDLHSAVWSVRKMIGKGVKGPKSEDVGAVANIVSCPDGKVRELIISTGGCLGFGEMNLAVKRADVMVDPGYQFV